MTTGSRYVTPYAHAYLPNGQPIPGALLNFYLTTSSTRSDTYKTSDLTGERNANPVVADDTGTFPAIFLDPAVVYKVVLTKPVSMGGTPVWTADPVYVTLDNGTPIDTGGGGGTTIVDVPAGAVMTFAQAAPPTGWLVCNGAIVSRTLYATLFAAIGTIYGVGDGINTFGIPDLRGEFVRGVDSGRGVDTGRALGSAQTGQNVAHTHTGTTDFVGAHTHTFNTNLNDGTGPAIEDSDGGSGVTHTITTSSNGDHSHNFTTGSDGGTETRPRNVALLYCIKT